MFEKLNKVAIFVPVCLDKHQETNSFLILLHNITSTF